jgi:hypothetical protein
MSKFGLDIIKFGFVSIICDLLDKLVCTLLIVPNVLNVRTITKKYRLHIL